MTVEIIEKEGLKRELAIEVPADVVDGAYEKTYKNFQKKAKLDGFRTGKVPISVIRQKFKREATAEIVDELVNKYFYEAVQEKKLEPVGAPVLTKVDVDEGKPLQFTLNIEIMPALENIIYSGLEVEKKEAEISDSDVDEVVEIMRKQNANLRVVDRSAQDTDIVFCDLKPISGAIEGLGDTPMENQEIDLDSAKTVKEFKEALLGVKRDDEKDVVLSYPEDHMDKNFAGKSVTFKTKVKEVKERILPVLDDSFAKMMGQGETLLELKLTLRKQMKRERESEIRRALKRDIVDQIVEKNQIDIPEAMLESYLKNMVEDMKKQDDKIDEKEMRDKYRPLGISTVRWYLLYHRLSTLEKIEVSPEDTENWIKKFADNYRMELDKAKEILTQTGKANEIKDGILEDKVLDFLASTASEKKGSDEN